MSADNKLTVFTIISSSGFPQGRRVAYRVRDIINIEEVTEATTNLLISDGIRNGEEKRHLMRVEHSFDEVITLIAGAL